MARKYDAYLAKITELLEDDPILEDVLKGIADGESDFRIVQRINKKIFDLDWLDAIEDAMPSLDQIVRNPRKFIALEEDIIDISLARSISVESVKHLAQHTQYIASVEDDKVTPSKILNISKEESFEVYENRFIWTLLLELDRFISQRYNLIMQSMADCDQSQILIESKYGVGASKMMFKMDAIARMPFEEVKDKNPGELTPLERVSRVRQILSGFMGSPFAKNMKGCALVRPPITRTNVFKKNQAFKKTLALWDFIQSYRKNGFKVETVSETRPLPAKLQEEYKTLLILNHVIMENLTIKRDIHGNIDLGEEEEVEETINPDDFPFMKLELADIRDIRTSQGGGLGGNDDNYKRIDAALDRTLSQYKINMAREEKELQAKLIARQKKEEARAIQEEEKIRRREQIEQEREERIRRQEEERETIQKAKEQELAKIKEAQEAKKAEQARIEQNELDALEAIKRARLAEMENLRNQELIKIGKRQAHLVQDYNKNVLIAVETMRLEEMKKKYREEFEKLIDDTFNELMLKALSNYDN